MFNAVLFDGEQKLHPEDLREADVDLSSVLKFNGHIETIQRLRDVVKKTAYGMDFVIWGIENQQKIHYAMPLRHMIEDALSYLKEYNEIAKRIWMKRPQIQKMNFYPDSKNRPAASCNHSVHLLRRKGMGRGNQFERNAGTARLS